MCNHAIITLTRYIQKNVFAEVVFTAKCLEIQFIDMWETRLHLLIAFKKSDLEKVNK